LLLKISKKIINFISYKCKYLKNRIFYISLLLLTNSYAQLFTFKNYNHKDGLILSSLLSIAQDKDGAVWLGTDGAGLQRFDGYKITTPNESVSENEHHVTSIDAIGDAVYFSSRYQGVYQLRNNRYEKLKIQQNRVGDYLAYKKQKTNHVIVGSKKIRVISNNGYREKFWSRIITGLIQFQEINGLIFIIEEKESFVVKDNQIIRIHDWLKIDNEAPFSFFTFSNKEITFYTKTNSKAYHVNLNKQNEIISLSEKTILYPKTSALKNVYCKKNKLIILDSSNNIFYSHKNKFKFLPKNHSFEGVDFEKVFIDQHNDFWAVSSSSGFFKISEAPFTKINLHEVYQNPLISFIYKSKKNEVFLSDFNKKTFVSSFQKSTFETYDFRIYSQTIFQSKLIFATNLGLMVYEKEKFSLFNKINSKTIFVFGVGNKLFYGVEKEGLYVYENNKTTKINECEASHVYTAQLNNFQSKIYFGTNDGIYEYVLADNSITYLNSSIKVKGSYAGISTIDSYGIIWFSFDKTLLGIKKNGNYCVIDDAKYFKSTLFYSLNSDQYGNIWIGTNQGVTKLKLNENGSVIGSKTFNSENGFEGYEAHMRSSFQDSKNIFIGTIEGLFMIKPKLLENLMVPPKPYIHQTTVKNSKFSVYDEDLIKVNYTSINPKISGVQYTYRLKGKNNRWSPLSSNTSAYFANLSDQNYVFQVKATYDGYKYSPIAVFKININIPFWKSTWFILLFILSITTANFILLNRSRSFYKDAAIKIDNYFISQKMKSLILVFAFISTTLTYLFAHKLDLLIPKMNLLNAILALELFVLILISFSRFNAFNIKTYSLKIVLYSVMIHAFIGLYYSNIHSFYVIVACLCASLAPIILQTINRILFFVILELLASFTIFFIIDDAIYNNLLFLIAIIISTMLSLFTAFIFNESFQKLYFTSSLINNAQLFVMVINEVNEVIFVNETFRKRFLKKSTEFTNQKINQLEQFLFNVNSKQIDYNKLLDKGKINQMLLITNEKKSIWVEWTTEHYEKGRKVLLGKDISNTKILENEREILLNKTTDSIVFKVDIFGKITDYNQKFENLFSKENNSLIGLDTSSILYDEDKNEVVKYFENQFKQHLPTSHYCFRVKDKFGNIRWIEQFTSILYEVGSTKLIVGFVCNSKDISELKQLKTEVFELKNQQLSDYSNINYLQKSFLMNKQHLSAVFSEAYVISKPKKIYSTNYFYSKILNEYKIFVYSNCDSEGIISSILSLYGSIILDDCISSYTTLDPGQLLNDFEQKIKDRFNNYIENSFRLKFDLTILILHKSTNKIVYASSGGKFLSIHRNDVFVHSGESRKIGENDTLEFNSYHTYELLQNKIDFLIFFTNDFVHQQSEKSSKPFTLKRLLTYFKQNEEKTLKEKIDGLDELLSKWKGNSTQISDITIVGIKI
jgi:PAS domain S-box-containing protein